MHHDDAILLRGFAHSLIRRKARAIADRGGFTAQDRYDIEQELRLRLKESLAQFDPAQAHINAFITTVVERAAISIMRERWARKRDWTGTQSLEVPTERGNVNALPDPRSGGRDARRRDIAIDLEDVLAALPEELRALALQLKERSVRQIAAELNVPRTTLYTLIRRLRHAFEKAGLRNYL
jgi:RNA polymerase sigma-70 factor (ECF subfamily)